MSAQAPKSVTYTAWQKLCPKWCHQLVSIGSSNNHQHRQHNLNRKSTINLLNDPWIQTWPPIGLHNSQPICRVNDSHKPLKYRPSGPSHTNSHSPAITDVYRSQSMTPIGLLKLSPKDLKSQACNQSFTTSVSQSITLMDWLMTSDTLDDFRPPTLIKPQEFLQRSQSLTNICL